MKVAYIAGKYRGKSHNEVYENIQKARKIAREFWMRGYVVICPHTNSIFMDGEDTEEIFLKGDLELLKRSDLLVVTGDWQGSEGTKKEVEFAEEHNIPILLLMEEGTSSLMEEGTNHSHFTEDDVFANEGLPKKEWKSLEEVNEIIEKNKEDDKIGKNNSSRCSQ